MGIVKEAIHQSKDDGSDFNSVIAELSKKASLNIEEINRVVEWTNTLKQLKLFKSGADKTKEFSVADAEEVKKNIYGDELKKESSYKHLDKYTLPEGNLTKEAHVQRSRGYQKIVASAYPEDSNELLKIAFARIDESKQLKKEAQVEKQIAQDRYYNSMVKIAENLNMHYSERFSEFEQSARDMFGNKALPYLNVLEKMARANCERLLNYKPKNVIKDSDNTSLLKEAMVNKKLYQAYSNVEDYADQVTDNFTKRIKRYGSKTL